MKLIDSDIRKSKLYAKEYAQTKMELTMQKLLLQQRVNYLKQYTGTSARNKCRTKYDLKKNFSIINASLENYAEMQIRKNRKEEKSYSYISDVT